MSINSWYLHNIVSKNDLWDDISSKLSISNIHINILYVEFITYSNLDQ